MITKKRIIWMAILMLSLFGIIAARLVQIQLVNTDSFSKHNINLVEYSVNQRMQSLVLDDGRGKFYDRNGRLINHVELQTLLLFPFLAKMDWPIEEVASIIGVSPDVLKREIEAAKEPFPLLVNGEPAILTDEQTAKINKLQIPGVFAARRTFPEKDRVAEQLIGSLTSATPDQLDELRGRGHFSSNLKVGDKGLQKTFDDFLLSIGESKLAYHVDAIGGPLFGMNVKYVTPGNPLYPAKVNTTIDLELQEAAEEILDQSGIQAGGLLLLDIDDSELRVVASRPNVDKKDPNAGIGSKNMMFTQSTLGSVFKTVVAAAAIEEQLVDGQSMFNCSLKLDGTVETDMEKANGSLNLKESFARSCNRTFGELAKSLSKKDPDALERYAEMLQLTGESGWKGNVYHSEFIQLHGEEQGRIWLKDEYKSDEKLVAQTAIGQQDVQATPLAVANMMATIARNGERMSVKAVNDVEYANGTTAASFKDQHAEGESISPGTAKQLQELLLGVVASEHGTARSLNGLPVSIAGKTGTAQTDKSQKLMNKWFAGYFPAEKPEYAIVAVNLQTDEQGASAVSLVRDFVGKMAAMDRPD